MDKIIYFDNSATTKPYDTVIAEMADIMEHTYGNPSSMHRMGLLAERKMKAAREIVAQSIGAQPNEIIFTSGGTESNNVAIMGSLRANKHAGKKVIQTAIEHPAVSQAFSYLKKNGYEVVTIPVDPYGIINLELLEQELDESVALVSCMLVNNEIGCIEPVRKIKEIIIKKRLSALFHIDAVQAFCKIPFTVRELGADFITISSHKIHGPKGVGALFVRRGAKISSIVYGGGQENDLRSGTENVAGICGFAVAIQQCQADFDEKIKMMKMLREAMRKGIEARIEYAVIHSQNSPLFAPHILNVSFPGIKSEVLLHSLESKGIMVSSGSACSSNKPALSATLTAIGLRREEVDSAIRFSFSHTNTLEEVQTAIAVLQDIVQNLRYTMRRR